MTAEYLSMLSGALLSLGFSYIPGLTGWYEKLGKSPDGTDDKGTLKRVVMLGLLIMTAGCVYGLACSGWGPAFGVTLTCDQAGLAGLLRSLVLAIMANQSTYQITPMKSSGPK